MGIAVAIRDRRARPSTFPFNTGAGPAPLLLDLDICPLRLYVSQPRLLHLDCLLPVHRSRVTYPTPELFRNLSVDNVKTRRVNPAATDIAGDGETVIVVEATYASYGVGRGRRGRGLVVVVIVERARLSKGR
ncbi:unnamed protein product [Somion occarium]|uniref:Uncharacterized protein n=1 Tax=Somion occarium TaxID=3059160 RepID=A0ABP1CVI2_9APHY